MRSFLFLTALLTPASAPSAAAQTLSDADARPAMTEIQASHVEANVPDEPKFSHLLLRDLRAYFAARGLLKPAVQFELLRRAATQSGVAYPKFYLWVRVRSTDGQVTSGAVRVAAVERRRFEITDFLSAREIEREPDRSDSIFPAPLVPDIVKRASSKTTRLQGSAKGS